MRNSTGLGGALSLLLWAGCTGRADTHREDDVWVAVSAPHVVRSAECEVRPDRVLEVPTGFAAVLVTAGPIEWVKPDEAEVDVIITRRTAETTRRRCRLVQEAGRWVCLGQVMKISPA